MNEQYDKFAYLLVVIAFVVFAVAGGEAFIVGDFPRGAFTMAMACFMLQVSLLLFSIVDEEDDDDDWAL